MYLVKQIYPSLKGLLAISQLDGQGKTGVKKHKEDKSVVQGQQQAH